MQRAFQAVFRQLDDRSLCNLLCGKLSDKGWIPHPLLPQIGIIVDHNTNIYNAPIANGNRMKHQSLGNGISPCFLHLSRGGLRQAITNPLQFYRNFLVDRCWEEQIRGSPTPHSHTLRHTHIPHTPSPPPPPPSSMHSHTYTHWRGLYRPGEPGSLCPSLTLHSHPLTHWLTE